MAAEVKQLIDESVMHHRRLGGKVGAAFATSGVAGGGCETTILDILHSLLVRGVEESKSRRVGRGSAL